MQAGTRTHSCCRTSSEKEYACDGSRAFGEGHAGHNIGYGRTGTGAEDTAIERAARLAQAHDFILKLPQGYDTLIGDQGVRLSGGQRQRIALARALLKDPPILILDEATAMFDPESEARFIEECRATLGGKTVLLITHRPASLALADRVVEWNREPTPLTPAPVPTKIRPDNLVS